MYVRRRPRSCRRSVAVSSGDGMNRSLIDSTYGVRSYSQPCEANSAVQMTSERKTSQSPDLASWRWTNCVRCSSAEAGNSTIFAYRPWSACTSR